MSNSNSTCPVEGCDRLIESRGFCGMHYMRWCRHGDPLYDPRRTGCTVEGCEGHHFARGWCSLHYTRWRRRGDAGGVELLNAPLDPTASSKQCPKCGLMKSLEDFYKERTRSDGRKSHCKLCTTQATRNWKAKNSDRVAAVAATWREANKEALSVQFKKWNQANPDKYKARLRNRRARKNGGGGKHTAEDLAKIRSEQRDLCYWCEKPLGCDVHIDHRIPISRGGSNWPNNIVLAHAICNLRKGSKMPYEFSDRLF